MISLRQRVLDDAILVIPASCAKAFAAPTTCSGNLRLRLIGRHRLRGEQLPIRMPVGTPKLSHPLSNARRNHQPLPAKNSPSSPMTLCALEAAHAARIAASESPPPCPSRRASALKVIPAHPPGITNL